MPTNKINVKVTCGCGEEPTAQHKLITEIALRIAYALPYHYTYCISRRHVFGGKQLRVL
jgi:hypothetical protein